MIAQTRGRRRTVGARRYRGAIRVVVVSAHFPPDFVSGGTLVPQRLARGLRARGHDARVFAGWLGDAEPLSCWDEEDPTGLPVRWVAIRPWIGWSDRHNFSNPPVEELFARYLEEVKPDLVHLHALQSLGAGLVEVARRAGCAVVVTMHDFWWICARQFLVDHGYHPCSLLVEAGGCPCEVDRPWLEARTALLRTALEHVDLVLAPSQSAADVLNANGVAGGRVEVDENGLPADLVAALSSASASAEPPAAEPTTAEPAAAEPAAAEPTRAADRSVEAPTRIFLYAGGPDRMKGWQVLVDAATLLAARRPGAGEGPDWSVVAYGIDPATVATGLSIDARPAFAEETLAAVLGAVDVLVLPSVMRETFSLLTREALCRGVPVVATDTLGPEEVIRDGHNGLIVPAADPELLADALERVLDEPALLDHLRAGCRQALPLRSVDDQVAALEARYRQVLAARAAGPAPTPPDRRPIRRVVFAVGIHGAPLRYRARLPAEGLRLVGVDSEVRYYRDPELPALLRQADAAVFYRVPATDQVLDMIDQAHSSGIPVLFDVDDLIFDPDVASEIPALEILPPAEADLWMEGVRRYRTTMERCDLFVGSTVPLCQHAGVVTGLPTERFANGVGAVLARRSETARTQPRPPGPPRIGYFSGTTTHDQDWALIEPSVLQVLDQRGDTELWLGGHIKRSAALDAYANRIKLLPMMPWTELPAVLRAVDVNLAPLVLASRFNQAKSAIKWLEAALVDTPTIASPTQPFREAIDDGVTGRLATTPDDWVGAIDELLADPRGATAMARRARRQALLALSPHLQGQRYLAILERAAAQAKGGKRGGGNDWIAVANDEPSMAVALEPYGLSSEPPVHAAPRQQTERFRIDRPRLVSVARRTVASLRQRGVRVTAQRARDVGGRHLRAAAREVRKRARSVRSSWRQKAPRG